MAATYNTSHASDKDWIRLMIGDRNTSQAVFQDEEIEAVLQASTSKWFAAATLASTLLARSGGMVRKRVKDLEIEWSTDAESSYTQHIQWLRKQGATELLRANGLPQHVFMLQDE